MLVAAVLLACDSGKMPLDRSCGNAATEAADSGADAGGAVERPFAGGVIRFSELGLCRAVHVLEPTWERARDCSAPSLVVPIRNASHLSLRLRAQLEFLASPCDAFGQRTACYVVTLAPGELRCVRATSRRHTAASYIVRLSRAR